MFNINNKQTVSDFIKTINGNLGVEIDKNSIDYDIFSALYGINKSADDVINNYLNGIDFENFSGEKLSNFFSLFNVKRGTGTNVDIYVFTVTNTSDVGIGIKKDSIIKFDGYNHVVLEGIYIGGGSSNTIYTQKTYKGGEFDNPVFSAGGKMSMDLSAIEAASGINVQALIGKNLKLTEYYHEPIDEESDFEFIEKGKNLMQLMGYSNNKIIETLIYEDKRVKNVVFSNSFGCTTITIIPNSADDLDAVMESAAETINYHKSERVVLKRPNVIRLDITGLEPSFFNDANSSEIISDIRKNVTEYITSSTINNFISSSEINNIIIDAALRLSSSKFVNINAIRVSYKYYSGENMFNDIFESDLTGILEINKNEAVMIGNIS